MTDYVKVLAAEFDKPARHVENIITLIDDGNTIPFIARYRKEMTGSMDDQALRELSERLAYLRGLDKRRGEVTESIRSQEKLTPELERAIEAAATLAEIEDIYRPYKPKRRTRGMIAREKGLEPLAAVMLLQAKNSPAPEALAQQYINPELGVNDAAEALAYARDIIAEQLSDDALIRKLIKELVEREGMLVSKAAKKSAAKDAASKETAKNAVDENVYAQYFDFSEPVARAQSHRVLAINRGENEGVLKVTLEIPEGEAINIIVSRIIRGSTAMESQLRQAIDDSFDRLIFPSIEREIRANLTEMADEQAIKTFSLNLKPLLLQPPVKNKVTLGFDPAYRTGCKLAVVDGTGKVLDTGVVYPTPPHNKKAEAAAAIRALIKKHNIEVVSIGNGTASRESEEFVAELIRGTSVRYVIVNEAGASVYSASKLGAAEFPEYDVSLRSAVSIARRLQDPLAELVKIDPKSIGVGQYQHDMPEKRLDEALSGVVEACVNAVGVDLNTASASLLEHVAGIGAATAKQIVDYREANGAFSSRKELLHVSKLGQKTFTQCAGFLRVPESADILDNTGVHPESYAATKKLISLCGYTDAEKKRRSFADIKKRAATLGETHAAEECGVGLPTLADIMTELEKPGRDIRDDLPKPMLRADVMTIDDLAPDMELMGTVRNVVDFGAFVDIGVHQDGLVHISQICDKYIKHPSEAVKTGDVVKVRVLSVSPDKRRISLTMKFNSKE